jgi:hypothetical protein
MSDPINAALDAAAKALCICGGECYATRHGPMNGPCEAKPAESARAVMAFLRALPARFPMQRPGGQSSGHSTGEMARLANLVEEAARGD